jgi:hypothetical protein
VLTKGFGTVDSGCVEEIEDARPFGRGTKTTQGRELGQRDDYFGFMVAIAIISLG